MGFLKSNTAWYLVRPAYNKYDERHLYDIAYFAFVLKHLGVNDKDIYYFIDEPSPALLNSVFSKFNFNPLANNIYKSNDIINILKNNTYENVLIFITGHGGIEGIDSPSPIKPYVFYEALKTAPCLKHVVIYFGQCEAGIYNNMSLDTTSGNYNGSKIVAIGAAGLHSSLSSSIIIPNNMWSANVFLAYIFESFLNNIDIDGDGKFTVMDSYKYATIKTSETCKEIEKEDSIETSGPKVILSSLLMQTKGKKLTLDQELEIAALKEKISLNEYNQTPWIMNPLSALDMEF